MERSKIYSILSKFTKSELSEFKKFIISPYYNESHNVIKLFDLLRPHHPDFSSRVLTKESLHRKIFKGESYSLRSIDNLVTSLRKLCDEFLSINNFKSNSGNMEIMLAEQYRNRGLDSLLINKLNTLINNYDPEKIYNIDQNHYFMNLHVFYTDYIIYHIHLEKKNRLFDYLLTDYSLINKYCYNLKLRLFIRLVIGVLAPNLNIELNPGLIGLIEDIRSCSEMNINPAAKINSEIAESLLNKTKFDYFRLKKELFNIQDKITNDDFDITLTLLVFYFFPQIDESDSALVRERFEHAKLMVGRKVWKTVEGNLKERNFTFVVYIAIKAGEIDWAENFIKFYSIYVVKEQRDDAINYNLALLNYTKAKFDKLKKTEYIDKALYYLNRFHIRDYSNKLHVFTLKTMIFFDQEQYDALFFECDAIDQFLLNNKEQLNKNIYQSYFDYSKYVKQLSQYIIDGNFVKGENLKEKINNNALVQDKDWLSEKIAVFLSKRKSIKHELI